MKKFQFFTLLIALPLLVSCNQLDSIKKEMSSITNQILELVGMDSKSSSKKKKKIRDEHHSSIGVPKNTQNAGRRNSHISKRANENAKIAPNGITSFMPKNGDKINATNATMLTRAIQNGVMR